MEKTAMGRRIHAVRKDRALTAEQLSECCHINATYLRQIESGAKMPSLPVFTDLCNALHISPSFLLQDVLEPNELSDVNELALLWKTASPSQIELVTAMIKAVLTHKSP